MERREHYDYVREFVAQVEPDMRRYLLRYKVQQSDVDDIIQNVVLKLLNIDVDRITNFRAYTYVIARHELYKLKKKKKASIDLSELLLDYVPESASGPADKASVAEELMRAIDVMSKLSPESKHIIYLRIFDKMRFKKIAEEFSSSEDAVRMRFGRAMRELRDLLERKGDAPPPHV